MGEDISPTLISRYETQTGNTQDKLNVMVIEPSVLGETDMATVVRRLTPLECERLQGFPDGWTDIGEWVDSKGKLHKDADSPRYKALGNSIAVGYANKQSGFLVLDGKTNGRTVKKQWRRKPYYGKPF